MADEPLPYQSVQSNIHKPARIAAVCLGWLYFAAAGTLATGMIVSAYLDRNGGPDAFNFANPWFYLTLVVFTSLLAAVGWGFVWAGAGIARKLPRRALAGKYLAIVNLALVMAEGAGIVVGIFMDPPKGNDRVILGVVSGAVAFFLAALVLTIWLLELFIKDMKKEKENHR